MIKVLYIAQYLPVDNATYAGTATVNYYIKHLAANRNFCVDLLGFGQLDEASKKKFDTYGIRCRTLPFDGNRCTVLLRKAMNVLGYLTSKKRRHIRFCWYQYFMVRYGLRQYQRAGYTPDVVILEWTQSVLYAAKIREIFPSAKLIGSESDVQFQSFQRMAEYATGKWKRNYLNTSHQMLLRAEVDALAHCDVVLPQNHKDVGLLIQQGIPGHKCRVLTPFYKDYSFVTRHPKGHDILFWGAMNRKENSDSSIWFIQKVMPLLQDTDARFIVVGNGPPAKLQNLASDRIIITGFVEKPDDYFANSMCLVAPLVLGAGIKVKVLEAFTAGIPVLTNDIGIEGIPAKDGVSYFHCQQPEDYAIHIRQMMQGALQLDAMYTAQKEVISTYFDLEKGKHDYVNMITQLQGEKNIKI